MRGQSAVFRDAQDGLTTLLRLSFRPVNGDSPRLMLAACVRFGADGTLRGPDNYVIARCVQGCWELGGRLHRELECEGPVRMHLQSDLRSEARNLGPFTHVRTSGTMFLADGAALDVQVPGRSQSGTTGQSLTLLSDGALDGKA